MRLLTSAALAAALVVPTAAAALENPVLVTLRGAEGTVGTATLFQSGDRVLVNVDFNDTRLQNAGVAIEEGRCDRLGRISTELSASVNGQSQTQVPGASVAQLVGKPHALVVRRSARADAPQLACGNITG